MYPVPDFMKLTSSNSKMRKPPFSFFDLKSTTQDKKENLFRVQPQDQGSSSETCRSVSLAGRVP